MSQEEAQKVSQEEIDSLYEKLKREAESRGYKLNPDIAFTKELVKSLIINQKRYGYWACPCRLASSIREKDLDIICPCDYRDEDLVEFGTCFCALYTSEKIKELHSIPERRNKTKMETIAKAELPVWRCKVCGYLCAREHPPEKCPICMADADRFEKFNL